VPLATVVARVHALAEPLGTHPVEAEIVGLVPAAALTGFPEDLPIRDFDPAAQTIEGRLPAAI
jgi:glutamate formiminotransferase